MVAHTVECFGTKVEWGKHDIGAPNSMIEIFAKKRGERIFAGMAAGAVAAVMANGNGLGKHGIESQGTGDGGGDLGDLEGMGEAGALVVGRKNEDLGFAGKAAEFVGVQDAVTVTFEAGAPNVWFFL